MPEPELQSVDIHVDYDDVDTPTLRLGGVFVDADKPVVEIRKELEGHWQDFISCLPDTDSHFLDYLKEQGYKTYETGDWAVCLQG